MMEQLWFGFIGILLGLLIGIPLVMWLGNRADRKKEEKEEQRKIRQKQIYEDLMRRFNLPIK